MQHSRPPLATAFLRSDAASRAAGLGAEESVEVRSAHRRQHRATRKLVARRRTIAIWIVVVCAVVAWLSIAIQL